MVYSYKKSFESLILVGRAPCVIAFKLLDEEADLLYFVSVPACVDRTSLTVLCASLARVR